MGGNKRGNKSTPKALLVAVSSAVVITAAAAAAAATAGQALPLDALRRRGACQRVSVPVQARRIESLDERRAPNIAARVAGTRAA